MSFCSLVSAYLFMHPSSDTNSYHWGIVVWPILPSSYGSMQLAYGYHLHNMSQFEKFGRLYGSSFDGLSIAGKGITSCVYGKL